ncbi:hypothetical protein TIFTF001_031816 [Ficus carica]|uniref:Uncharacterized protein n=1 Tax=Ficus carica TaxID=3494 RepID=A0AA88J1K7_FICCA|nr:hypothetical protein TIFTF001_031816 [Ficus carica]
MNFHNMCGARESKRERHLPSTRQQRMGFKEEIGGRSCGGKRERERRERELVVESRLAKMEGGVTAEEMSFEGEFGEARVKEARE